MLDHSQALDEATRIARMVGDVSCLAVCRRCVLHEFLGRLLPLAC